jgi:pyruvate/2-oxoglutarate dehydrogenase complex dihydrolipoamide acyltransferase (E2) component
MTILPMRFPKQRRHTLYFLEEAARHRPVFLDTSVDMSAVTMHRQAAGSARCGWLAYLVHSTSRAIRHFPEANAMLIGGVRPRLARFPRVNAKITLDKRMEGVRNVVSGVIADADGMDVNEIQQSIDTLKAQDPATDPAHAGLRRLQSLPVPAGRAIFSWLMRSPKRKAELQGSYAITSLGNSAVDGFLPMIGATITFGAGHIAPAPVVVGTEIVIRPLLRLTMAFDHRVLDGAIAAELLTQVKQQLETFPNGNLQQEEQSGR